MKKLLLIALLTVAAVALVAAPGWAGKAGLLSDTELAAVYGGDGDINQTVDNSSDENVLVANTVNSAGDLNCDAGCIDAATNAVNVLITMHSISAQQSNATGTSNTVTSGGMSQSNIANSRVGGGNF